VSAHFPWSGQAMISPAQFAEAAHVSSRTVLRLIRDGKLVGVKIGQSYRIPRAEAFRLLCAHDPDEAAAAAVLAPAIRPLPQVSARALALAQSLRDPPQLDRKGLALLRRAQRRHAAKTTQVPKSQK
jgi:excisionase family DNA binding protein